MAIINRIPEIACYGATVGKKAGCNLSIFCGFVKILRVVWRSTTSHSQNQFSKRIEAMEVEGMPGISQYWQVKPGSIYDDNTLQVVRDG
ncbi:MAG: hypothetical protein SWY16_11135 [Cyanobacteriota bacterium]|nr:hypothetical protein [Cyanobacteriota bacterium]